MVNCLFISCAELLNCAGIIIAKLHATCENALPPPPPRGRQTAQSGLKSGDFEHIWLSIGISAPHSINSGIDKILYRFKWYRYRIGSFKN